MKTVNILCTLVCTMLLAVLPAAAQNTNDDKNKAIIETTEGSQELNTDEISVIRFNGGKVTVVQPSGETTFDRTLRSLSFQRPNPGTLRLTATTSIGTEGTGNRAQTIDGEGKLKTTWESCDKVYVYATENGTTSIGTLTPKEDDWGEKSATLTGDINADGLTDGVTTLYFSTKDRATLDLSTQDGTVGSLFYFTATGTITINGANASVSNLSFKRPIAIVKFTLKDKATDNILSSNPTAFSVNYGTGCVSLTNIPASTYTGNGNGVLYVGIPAITSQTVTLTATDGNEYYLYQKTGVSFANNEYYGINVKMQASDLARPLTFEAKTAGAVVTFTAATSISPAPSIEYSLNGGAWTAYTGAVTLTNEGDKVSFRGTNARYATTSFSGRYSYFSCSKECYLYGNIMSLISKENYATTTALTSDYTFCRLFYENTNIYNHDTKALVLPAITLAFNCYEQMFYGCTSLTAAPALPATTLATGCYQNMFRDCTTLATAPELPATTLAPYCYSSMFQGCTSLATAPELPVKTLAENCYQNMFQGCTQLTTAPALPATTLTEYCYNSMFKGCTGLTASPVLPATTLVDHCYDNMFDHCSNLNKVTCLATNFQLTSQYATCTYNWLANVAPTGIFYKSETMNDWTLSSPHGIPSGWTVKSYETLLPLTFEAKTAGAVVTFSSSMDTAPTIQYSKNGGEWTTYTEPITLTNVSDKVSFRGDNATYATSSKNSNFSCSDDCYIYGNIMSLISPTEYPTVTEITESYAFSGLFQGNTHIVNHSSKALVLPATTLEIYCYNFMFSGCTGLTTAPELPATTLAESCYRNMFNGCTNLTTAPALPAEVLANNCYQSMFKDCTSLTTAPELPAEMLANNCYQQMFSGCKSLNSVTCLATYIMAENCTVDWLKNVAAAGTFYKPESTADWTTGANGIPSGWTAKDVMLVTPLTFEAKTAGTTVTFTKSTDIDNLPIKYSLNGGAWTAYDAPISLANVGDKVSFRGDNATYAAGSSDNSTFSCSDDCYIYGNIMSLIDKDNFAKNTTLTDANAFAFNGLFTGNTHIYSHADNALLLPATTLAESCYAQMFLGCMKLTTAPALPATTLTDFCYYQMFSGCENLTTAPELPATTLAKSCYGQMFYGCTNLTTAPALPATTLANGCYSTMFYGCESLTTAPALPATTLAEECYSQMFQSCTNLTTAPALPAETLVSYCYYWMFYDCEKLNSVTCLATDISASNCTPNWLNGVATTGTFYKPESMADWTTGANGIPSGWTVIDYETLLPLTFEAKTAGAVVTFSSGEDSFGNIIAPTVTIEYSLNGGAWTNYSSAITLSNVGDKVSFRGDNAYYDFNSFCCSDECYIYGNVMSLINSADYATTTALTEDYALYALFRDNAKIFSHPSIALVLPATTLTTGCYMEMFKGCTSLTQAPELPAEILAERCYSSMFKECSSLTATPALPAETLAEGCYSYMFQDCTSLLTAPSSLPAATLTENCYSSMFYRCTSLAAAPELPAMTMKSSSYQCMFGGCTNLTSAPALPATTLDTQCYLSMFSGCTNLTIAPSLPATTLANFCYDGMFRGCTSLTTSPVLSATTLSPYCYQYMFKNCSNLNSVTCLATEISASDCTNGWLDGVATTGAFTKAASADWSEKTGANGIPSGWTTVDAVIDLATVTTDITVSNGWTVTGTLAGNYKITIADGATVTLSGVTINRDNSDYNAGITCDGNATIILADGTTNTVVSVNDFGIGSSGTSGKTLTIQGNTGVLNVTATGAYPGIGCYNGANIEIQGGIITATGGYESAGIGSARGWTCGNITISGGTINATGTTYGAGIGCSSSGTCGDITITTGVTRVTATKGANNSFSIGHANPSNGCGTITIGGTVYYDGSSYQNDGVTYLTTSPLVYAPALAGSISYATTEVNKTTADAAFTNELTLVGDGTVSYARSAGDNICTVNASTGEVTLNGTAGTCTITATVTDGPSYTYATNTASYTLTVTAATINLATVTTDTTVPNGWTVTGTLGSNVKISIADGATVTLDGVSINADGKWESSWAGITCEGDATIILKDGTTNTVRGFAEKYPGIQAAKREGEGEEYTLTISGTGSLNVSSNGWGAGIGGGKEINCGSIEIQGGTITAWGGNAAGIGSGNYGICGDISITGGDITASGGTDAAGIGTGLGGICGNITITNGVTKVKATKGGDAPNSIGAGYVGNSGTVTIGGTVYYNGSSYQNDGETYLATSPLVYKPGVALANSNLGDKVCSDGKAYPVDVTLPGGVTLIGVVARKSGSSGIVLYKEDNSGTYTWENRNSGNPSAVNVYVNDLSSTTSKSWTCGDRTQYTNCGVTGSAGWSALQTRLTNAGCNELVSGYPYYWTNTETSSTGTAWAFYDGNWDSGGESYARYVRPLFAF